MVDGRLRGIDGTVMFRAAFVALVLVATVGCSDSPEDQLEELFDSWEQSSEVTVVPTRAWDPSMASAPSVLDVVGADGYEAGEQTLLGLLAGPRAVGDGVRLGQVVVDDPNGTARVDGRWYPPRIQTSNCRFSVDNAPIPTAGAMFVPGDPDEGLSEDPFEQLPELMGAPHTISVQVQLFDDAVQRDEFASTMEEFFAMLGDFECDVGGAPGLGDGLFDLFGKATEVELYDVGVPGSSVQIDGLTPAHISQYLVGETVLLTVSVSGGMFGAMRDTPPPDPAIARRAIDAQIARLEAMGYT